MCLCRFLLSGVLYLQQSQYHRVPSCFLTCFWSSPSDLNVLLQLAAMHSNDCSVQCEYLWAVSSLLNTKVWSHSSHAKFLCLCFGIDVMNDIIVVYCRGFPPYCGKQLVLAENIRKRTPSYCRATLSPPLKGAMSSWHGSVSQKYHKNDINSEKYQQTSEIYIYTFIITRQSLALKQFSCPHS